MYIYLSTKNINIMTNQTIYQLINLKTIILMARFFDLNYYKDVRTPIKLKTLILTKRILQ